MATAAGTVGKILRLTAGLIFSVLIFAGFGELLARQFNVVDILNGFPRRRYIATDLPDLPYRFRPGFKMETDGRTVRINRFGLRGPEIEARPAPGGIRVLVLGDSVVFGMREDEEETFSGRLQEALQRATSGRVEVLNAGTPGYNTTAELAFFLEHGVSVHPDLVLLGVSFNDIGNTPVLTSYGVLTQRRGERDRLPWLSNRSEFYILLQWLLRYARGEHVFQRIKQTGKANPVAPPTTRDSTEVEESINRSIGRRHQRLYRSPNGPGWERIRTALTGLRDETRRLHMPFLVVISRKAFRSKRTSPTSPRRSGGSSCVLIYRSSALTHGQPSPRQPPRDRTTCSPMFSIPTPPAWQLPPS